MSSQKIIAQSYTLKNGTVVKNRLLKSAMSEALGESNGAPKPDLTTLYGVWANGGIGICVTGNVMIDQRALGEPGNVIIEDEAHLPALQKWAKAATQHNTQCWVQLNHPGKQAPKGLNAETVSPSAIPFKKDMQSFFLTPRALTEPEIKDLIQRFANAAAIVQKAGFTGVQIHGAHGYLVSQFLSPHHNIRTDQYGGNPENRRRFVLEIYHAMREKVGASFPISIKLNSADFQRGGFSEDESLDLIRVLSEVGMDLIEISGGTYEAPVMTGINTSKEPVKESTKQREAYFLDFAEKARKVCTTALVVTGGFRSADGMAQAISSGAVDFVGLARLLAVEPDAPNKLISGQPIQQVKPIKVGVSAIDKMGILETSWYSAQLKRIGNGNLPDMKMSPWLVLFKTLYHLIFGKKAAKLRAN